MEVERVILEVHRSETEVVQLLLLEFKKLLNDRKRRSLINKDDNEVYNGDGMMAWSCK